MNSVEFELLMKKADEQVWWTGLMKKVNAQTFSLRLFELKFHVWLNSFDFEQSYWAFSYLLTKLMNRSDEHVWWTRLMHRLLTLVYMGLSFKFGWILLSLSKVIELLVLLGVSLRVAGWLGGWLGANLNIVIALASLEPINIYFF